MLVRIHTDQEGPPASKPDAQIGRHEQPSAVDTQNERAAFGNQSRRVNQTSGHVDQPSESNVHSTRPKIPDQQAELPCNISLKPIHTIKQLALWAHLRKIGDQRTSNPQLAEETGIAHGTIRQILRHFETNRIISKWPYVDGAIRGITIRINPDWMTKTDVQISRRKESSSFSSDTEIQNLKKNLSILAGIRSLSREEFRSMYPSLAQIGFGADQLRQVAELRHKFCDDLDSLFQSLGHAEAELDSLGHLAAKDGAQPNNECNYLFKSLARRGGYYRAPAGYRSPEQIAFEDRARRANAERDARERADKAEYALWKQRLSAQERDELTHCQIEAERRRGRTIRDELVGGGEWLLEIYWYENIRRSPCTSLPTTAPGKETL